MTDYQGTDAQHNGKAYDNGRHPDTHPVTFGEASHQELTVEVASAMLTRWREKSPKDFGAYLSEVLVGVRPQGTRAPRDGK